MSDKEVFNEKIVGELELLKIELENLRTSFNNDLFNHKQTESELRKREEQLNYALESSADGLWDLDFTTNCVFYSTGWKAMLGFGETEIGDSLNEWSSRICPFDLEMVKQITDHHKKGKTKSFSFEHRLACKDGTYKWILNQGKIVARDEAGNPLRAIGTHKDINQRKKNEFELNERLKELNCHNRISEVLRKTNISEYELIEKIIEIIPGSWQFPVIAQVSIRIYDKVFKTSGYRESETKLEEPVVVNGVEIGQIIVNYPSGSMPEADQLFLPEESNLLFSIAERLGNFIERDQKELELKTSEGRYRNLIENITDVIYTTDIHANITFISPSVTKLLGYLPEEIVGKNFIHFVGDKSEQLTKRFQEIQKKTVLQSDYQILSKTGEQHWVRFSSKGLFNELQFTGVTGTLTDITETKLIELELQKSESLYRSILTASPDTIFIADLNGNVLFTSPMALKMFGYEETGFPINTPLFDFVDPKDHSKAREAIQDMFEGNYTGATEYVGIKSDGSKFDMEVNGEFIRDAEGKPTSMVFVTRDISDRKLANENLRKSEEQYRKLVESINDVIYEIDATGNIKFASPSILNILGYSVEEVLGQNIFSFVYPEDVPGIMNNLKNLTTRDYKFLEYRYIRKDGSVRWVRSSTSPIIVDGEMIGGTGTLTDITERKLAEEKLRKSEETYRYLVETINDVIYEITLDGTVKFISPAVKKVIGYSSEELVGNNLFNIVYPDDMPELLKRMASYDLNEPPFLDLRVITKEGDIRWIRSLPSKVIENGNVVGRKGILTDITLQKIAEIELKETEEQYRKLVESINDAIYEINIEGTLKYISPAIEKILGYTAEELIGKNAFEFLYPDDAANVMEALLHLGEIDIPYMEYRYITKSGKFCWVRTSTTPIYEYGKLKGGTGTLTDITERKLAEEALRVSEEKFRNIFVNAQEGIFQTNTNGLYLSVNPALAKMYGFDSPEELMNSRVNISNDSYSDPKERDKFLRMMNDQGYISGYEYEVKRKDGSRIWFYEDAKAVKDEDGVVQYFEGFVVDITERKLAENTLKDKTDLLTNLIINLQEGILLEDSNRNIALTNQLFCEMFAIPAPPEALIGADCSDSAEQSKHLFKNPEKFIADIVLILAEKKAVFNDELELTDGRYLERDYIPTYIENKYNGHLWKYRDITLRKQTVEALGASELKYRNLVENINDVVYIVNQKGIIKYISPTIEKILGYTAEELTGKNFSNFVGENAGNLSKRLLGLNDNTELEKEYKIFTKKGVPCYIRLSTKAVFEDGIFAGGSGTLIDITDRKRAEEGLRKLSQAVEQSPAMTLITNLNGEIEFVNTKLIELTGYRKEELIGENPRIFSTFEKGKKDYIDLWQTISSGKDWKGELHNKKKNGDLFWAMASISPVFDSNGDISHYVAVEEDITKRKEIEEKIIQQNERLNAIISAMPDLIFVMDVDGNTREFYSSAPLPSFVHFDNVIGINLSDIFDKETTDLHIQKTRECIQLKKLITYEYELNIENSASFFEARLAPLGSNKVLTFVREITERKEAENEIQDLNANLEIKIVERTSELAIANTYLKSEIDERNKVAAALEEALSRLHKIADQVPGVVFQFRLFADGTSCFPYASEGLWDIFRVRPEEVINDASIIFSRIHPDYLDDIYASIQKSAQDMQLLKYEFQVKFDDGTVQWLYGKFSPQPEADGSVLWHGFITDISELKLAEDALRQSEIKHSSMISNISDVIGIMGTDGIMKYKSPNIVKDFGWQPEDLVGTDGWLTVHPDDIERIKKELYTVLQKDNAVKTVEYKYLCKDGSYKPIELTATNLINDKVINGVLLNYHDITERKQAEEKITEARNIAEKANLAKSEFLSRMSHELRTPMNSILGFAQLLEMGELNKGQKKSVSHIFHSGKHLLNLINEVLDISRIEAGHVSILLESVNVIAVLNEMIDIVRQQAIERQLKLVLKNSSNGKLYVNTDLQRLKQILLNLLSNAIKYNRTGGSVIIKAEMMPINIYDIVYLRIEITDFGPGISTDDIAKLFTPFERIGAEKTETEGTGLGLAVVKKLMDALNGNVGVSSIPGEGSTFWIELPVTGSLKTNKALNEENQKQAAELIVANKELAFQNEEKSKRADELVIANKELAFQNEEKAKRADELVIANKELAYQNEEKSKRADELVIANKELAYQNVEKSKRADELVIANIELAYQNEEKAKRVLELNIANTKLATQYKNRLIGAPVIEKTSTILYVEDNLPNAELVEEILNNHRPSIRLVTSIYGNYAVKFAADYRPDLILLDLDLPDIHGSNVLLNLMEDERTKSIPVIIISADAMPNQIIHLLKSGAKDYITKPLDIAYFLHVLDKWIPQKE